MRYGPPAQWVIMLILVIYYLRTKMLLCGRSLSLLYVNIRSLVFRVASQLIMDCGATPGL
jgi:hypothetical protein